jgi:LEA14-like dessication related protein
LRKIHFLIICSFFLGVLWTCPSVYGFKNPEIELKTVHILGIDQSAVTLEGTLEIKNPNDLSTRFSGFQYQFEVEGQRLSTGESSQPFQIPALKTVLIAIPATILFEDLFALGKKGILNRDLMYVLKGTAILDTWLGKIPLPFSYQGTLNLSDLLREKTRQFLQGFSAKIGPDATL